MPASSHSLAPEEAWEASVNVADEIEVAGDRTPDPASDDVDVDVDVNIGLGQDQDHLEPAGPGSAQDELPQEGQQHLELAPEPQVDTTTSTSTGDRGAAGVEDDQGVRGGDESRGEPSSIANNGNDTGSANGAGSANGRDHDNDDHKDHGTCQESLSRYLSQHVPPVCDPSYALFWAPRGP